MRLRRQALRARVKADLPITFSEERISAHGGLEVFARFLAAIDLHRLHQVSMWDALLVACARRAGCVTLLSEDLQHARRFDGVRIEDPFA